MSYSIPDTRWEMPELLTPGRKPVGNVILDKSDQIARDLWGYWLVNEGSGFPRNLVSNKNDFTFNTTMPAWGIGKSGRYLDFYPSAANSNIWQDLDGDAIGTGDFSFFVKINHVHGGIYYPIAFSGEFSIFSQHTSSSNNWGFYDGSRHVSGEILTDGEDYCLLVSRKGSTISLYRDGKFVTSFSNSKDITTNRFVMGSWTFSVAAFGRDKIYFAGVLKRSLSAAEVWSLHHNNYKVLTPA